jgi:hypothetical protein
MSFSLYLFRTEMHEKGISGSSRVPISSGIFDAEFTPKYPCNHRYNTAKGTSALSSVIRPNQGSVEEAFISNKFTGY